METATGKAAADLGSMTRRSPEAVVGSSNGDVHSVDRMIALGELQMRMATADNKDDPILPAGVNKSGPKAKKKKPFLRKGARKEPLSRSTILAPRAPREDAGGPVEGFGTEAGSEGGGEEGSPDDVEGAAGDGRGR